jgi:A/G-specific adenine glycosylase
VPVPPARRATLRRRLLVWYDAYRRELPWRFAQRGADPYRVWLAEVMLQQTQVRTAIPYYERFLAAFPTLEALAAAPEEDVLARWSGLGYYARARNLHAAAREALTRHGGLPASLDALRALRGFGPYTAGAVASIAFAIPAPAVDGNVARVLARLFLLDGDPAARDVRTRIDALAAALVDPVRPGDWNQALMELGATVCRKPVPACARCPVARGCAARSAGREAEIPRARRRPARAALRIVCAVVERGGELLAVRRPPGGLWGGLWELPGAEIAPDAPRAAVRRALTARLGAGARIAAPLATVTRVLTHRTLELEAWAARLGPGAELEGARFVSAEGLVSMGISTATRALVAALGEGPRSSREARGRPKGRPTCSTQGASSSGRSR